VLILRLFLALVIKYIIYTIILMTLYANTQLFNRNHTPFNAYNNRDFSVVKLGYEAKRNNCIIICKTKKLKLRSLVNLWDCVGNRMSWAV
jgi:hypothetical protein